MRMRTANHANLTQMKTLIPRSICADLRDSRSFFTARFPSCPSCRRGSTLLAFPWRPWRFKTSGFDQARQARRLPRSTAGGQTLKWRVLRISNR